MRDFINFVIDNKGQRIKAIKAYLFVVIFDRWFLETLAGKALTAWVNEHNDATKTSLAPEGCLTCMSLRMIVIGAFKAIALLAAYSLSIYVLLALIVIQVLSVTILIYKQSKEVNS